MCEIQKPQLEESVTDALERIAFMLVDPIDSVDPASLSRHARIAYSGTGVGTVHVSASDDFLIELASSLLGVQPDEVSVETEGRDALRAFADILAGSLLTRLGAEDHPFHLGLPEDAVAYSNAPNAITCAMSSMGEPLVISWCPSTSSAQAA